MAARAGAAVRNAPVTVALVAFLWLVGAATGSLMAGPSPALRAVVGSGVGPVRDGRWWTVLTSVPWCAQLLGYVVTSLAVLVLLPFAERRLGAARTVAGGARPSGGRACSVASRWWVCRGAGPGGSPSWITR